MNPAIHKRNFNEERVRIFVPYTQAQLAARRADRKFRSALAELNVQLWLGVNLKHLSSPRHRFIHLDVTSMNSNRRSCNPHSFASFTLSRNAVIIAYFCRHMCNNLTALASQSDGIPMQI